MRKNKSLAILLTLVTMLIMCSGISFASTTDRNWVLNQTNHIMISTEEAQKNSSTNIYFYQTEGYSLKTEVWKKNGTVTKLRGDIIIPVNVKATIRSSAGENDTVQLKIYKYVPINNGVQNRGVWSEDSTAYYTVF